MFVEYSLTCVFHHVWEKFFNFMVFAFLKNTLNLRIFTHAQVPQSKPLAEFLENLFPQGEKGGEKYDLLY